MSWQRSGLTLLSCLVLAVTACAGPALAPPVATQAPPVAAAGTAQPSKPASSPTTPPPAATSAPSPANLKFGTTQTIVDAGIYVAVEKGYFAQQAITMQVVNFASVAELIAPLGTGQIDVAALPLSAPLLTAGDRGVDLKIVSGSSQHRANWEYGWIVLRKDLADSGQVKTPADLKGMKVSIPSLASAGQMNVEMMLEQAGLPANYVDTVVVPFADQAAAFGNKAIAASFSVEPFIARGVQQGFSVKWVPMYQIFGKYGSKQDAQLNVFGPSMLKDPELSRRWMIAYLQGVKDYLDAFTTMNGRQQVVDILVKYSTIKDPKLYDVMEMPYLIPDGRLDMSSASNMKAQYKWYVDKGLYTGKKTLEDLMDLSYVQYAAQKLGVHE